MRALLIGATGGTGREIIRRARERDIGITALVRTPDKLGPLAAHATVITGDVFNHDELAQAASSCGAAICTIGAPAGFLRRGTTTGYSRAATALTGALARADVPRLVFCTSPGVEPHDPGEVWPYHLIAKPLFLQRAYDDMSVAEHTIRHSDLERTIVRPARLTGRPGTGRHREHRRGWRRPRGPGAARRRPGSRHPTR